MSYDLYFMKRGQGAKITVEEIISFFKDRKNYETNKTTYENKATGVYFAFQIGQEHEKNGDVLPVSFNLNYFRPHIFGLEAEQELKLFVEKFNLRVFDPQNHGMGEGAYSTDGFLRGWNAGNEFGYRSILSRQKNQQIFTLPTATIEACWKWNFQKDRLQSYLGQNYFVPRFIFLNLEGKVNTAVVWPDGIPSALPYADMYMIPRKAILKKGFFHAAQEDTVFVKRADLENILSSFELKEAALQYRLPMYTTPPPDIASRIRQFSPLDIKPSTISVDTILNAELVEKIKNESV